MAKRRRGPSRLLGVCLSFGGVAALAVFGLRPWMDSVMSVTITVAADGRPSTVVYRAHKLLREETSEASVLEAEIDLAPWKGQLVRVSVDGHLRPRLAAGITGCVACAAELRTAAGNMPIEFLGWRQRPGCHFHPGPVGPQVCSLGGGEDEVGDFVFAAAGGLWHVLAVPSEATLRVALRPLPTSRRPAPPERFLPQLPRERGLPLPSPAPRSGRPPDVFIYLIDTLRADHLSCHGYPRPTSPAIDAFAADAMLCENAHTAATWTRPSVATILTGLYPSVHGAMSELDVLPEWPMLLPEMLRDAGYTTLAIATNPNIAPELGLGQGWHHLTYQKSSAAWVNRMARAGLSERRAHEPVFMYLHTMEPHSPYDPEPGVFRMFDRGIESRYDGTADTLRDVSVLRPQLSQSDFAHLIDLYDAEIFEADRGFADFLQILKDAGRYERSLIVLVSDHGEAFGEHGTFGHGWDLNQEAMHVVLIIRFPSGEHAGVRVQHPVSLIDILPTVLSAVGLRPELSYPLPGTDLARMADPAYVDGGRLIYGEVSKWASNDLDLAAVIDEDGYKRVVDLSVLPRENAAKKSLGLWHSRSDPKESLDLLGTLPVRASYGEQLIARWLHVQQSWCGESRAPQPRAVMSDALRRELEALGYLQPHARGSKRARANPPH